MLVSQSEKPVISVGSWLISGAVVGSGVAVGVTVGDGVKVGVEGISTDGVIVAFSGGTTKRKMSDWVARLLSA